MATRIHSIQARWVDYSPDSASGTVSYATQGVEKQIRWGIPIASQKYGLGFSETPSGFDVDIGSQFSLGLLRHFNYGVLPPVVTAATLELTIRFNNESGPTAVINLGLGVLETPDDSSQPEDFISLDSGFPTTLSVGDARIELLGFRDLTDIVGDQVVTPENTTGNAALIARLLESPLEGEGCEPGFTPVFQPDKCEIQPICPIEDFAVIEDCGIPEPPEPITDCPDIDIPIAIYPKDGRDGEDGEDGEDGQDGCTPEISYSYYWYIVEDCSEVRVEVSHIAVPPCGIHFIFKFWLCYCNCLYTGCCRWLWCGDEWVSLDHETNPLYCSLFGGPPEPGRFAGELVFYCDCAATTPPPTTTTTTTTTTTAPPTTTVAPTTTTTAPPETAILFMQLVRPDSIVGIAQGDVAQYDNTQPGTVRLRAKNNGDVTLVCNWTATGNYVSDDGAFVLLPDEEVDIVLDVIGAAGFRTSSYEFVYNGLESPLTFTIQGIIT